jgi:signal transduction histidine kinase
VSAAQIYFAWNSRLQEIDVAIEEKVNASLPALNRGVWFLDEKQVKANIDVIATSPYIGRVEVSVAGRPGIFVMAGDVTKKFEFDRTWPIAGLEDKQGAEIGLIRVFGTHEAMNSALIKQAEFIVGTNLIKGMALSLVLLFIFDVLVSRHIREFMRHFYRFNLDEIEPLPRRNVKVRDEMDFLIDAINDMQATVTKSRNEERAAIAASEEAHNKTAELALKVGAAEVTTSVLHDVNNILGSLTAITMRSKRDMKVKQADEVLTGMIEGIEMTTKTIAGIIHSQQLMAMGGGERWDTVPIGLAVQDAVAMENYSLEKYKIKLIITGNQDQILVTRRHIIVTVLVNLIKNARESIQAANPERREIEINADTATEGTLRLTVRDTGLGATPGFIKEFPAEKFYRDAKIGKLYEGTSNMQKATIF